MWAKSVVSRIDQLIHRAAAIAVLLALLPAAEALAGRCDCTSTTLLISPAFSVFRNTPLDTAANFSVNCNGNATYDVSISAGYSGDWTSRAMYQGGNSANDALRYNIYTDPARTAIWSGVTRRTYETQSGQTTFTEPLYLRFPGTTQDVAASGQDYWDVVTVTFNPVGGGGTNSCTLRVQTRVEAECTAPDSTLSFGAYDPVSVNATTPRDATAALLYRCTKGVAANVQIDNGLSGVRQMQGPQPASTDTLAYQLFTNPGRTTIWTTVIPGTVSATSTSKNVPLGGAGGLTVYGRIPPGQNVTAGSYSQNVTATINY